MRSSKSRSRSKNNRNRNTLGNVVNRVFDSNGPEGKVRGTPQQIIDKYNQLARDASLANDRVAAENFQQHAEHYLRMLAEAQREQDQRREQQERENRERQAQRDRERAERAQADGEQGGDQPDVQPAVADQTDADAAGSGDSGLVETPEAAASGDAPAAQPDRPRKPRRPRRQPSGDAPEGEADQPAPRRRRKAEPAADAAPAAPASDGDAAPAPDAAE